MRRENAVEPERTTELLCVRDLHITSGGVEILRGVNLDVGVESAVGIVGESGSGKSMTASAIIRLLPRAVQITAGAIAYSGRDLLAISEMEMRAIRGRHISIVYQNAVESLNPLLRVGEQLATVCKAHMRVSHQQALRRGVEMLGALGLSDPERVMREYPYRLSGGMAQRASIALALICSPRLLIADEPTTGLDATIQAQVLDVIQSTAKSMGTAVLLISHDLAVVQAVCESVVVMYAGIVLEHGPRNKILSTPASPYTQGLVNCFRPPTGDIAFIPGRMPEPGSIGHQCPFVDRCYKASARCRQEPPELRQLAVDHWVACHNA